MARNCVHTFNRFVNKIMHWRQDRRGKAFTICLLVLVVMTISWKYKVRSWQQQREHTKRLYEYLEGENVVRDYKNDATSVSEQACVHPKLPLWSKEVFSAVYGSRCSPVVCNLAFNWVYTEKGKFYISAKAAQEHGHMKCSYWPIVNENEGSRVLGKVAPMVNGSWLTSDAFRVSCTAEDGQSYNNIHACIAVSKSERKSMMQHVDYGQADMNKGRSQRKHRKLESIETNKLNKERLQREHRKLQSIETNKLKKERLQRKHEKFQSVDTDTSKFNVLMIGLDSLSKQALKRFMPQTNEAFTQTLGGVVLESYNIVGDGTTQALLPILAGVNETDIPEVRRSYPGARFVDEATEFIWTAYKRKGYITQWAEDHPRTAAFNLRLMGFNKQPTRHYMRPYYLEQEPLIPFLAGKCHGAKTKYQIFLDWFKEGIDTNFGKPFFSFGFFSDYTHNDNNCANLADEDTVAFIEYFMKYGLRENTFLILMSDHGLRTGPIRAIQQGKLEERMPYFGIYVPENFRKAYPQKYATFMDNVHRLTTPFDIHETLLDILGEENYNLDGNPYIGRRKSYSLFSPIPKERTCTEAGVLSHWCACLNWQNISITAPNVLKSADKTLSLFNTLLDPFSSLCQERILKRVIKAMRLETNDALSRFRYSKDRDGRKADMSGEMSNQKLFYQITIETSPGNGLFEVTSTVDAATREVSVTNRDISRISLYHNDPYCIAEVNPALRPFCVCK